MKKENDTELFKINYTKKIFKILSRKNIKQKYEKEIDTK